MKSPLDWFRRKLPAKTPARTVNLPSMSAGHVETVTMPWGAKGTKAASVAMHYVESTLMNGVQDTHGIQVETLMTAVGAVAGFSAQNAVWESVVKPGKLPLFDAASFQGGAFTIAETKDGEKYYFGDTQNSYLIPQITKYGPEGRFTLYSFVAAAVQEAGGRPLEEATYREIFKNAAATFGTPAFGVPRVPEKHLPRLTAREALNKLWPATKEALQFRDPHLVGDTPDEFTPLPPEYWPFMLGIVAQRLVEKVKGVIDPALAMRLIFEAAVPMSKVDPTTVPQGR